MLDDKIYENSYILYKLNTKNNSVDYTVFNIKPNQPGTKDRTIEFELILSDINKNSGNITKGLITNNGLTNSFSYVFGWEILNK